MKLSIIIPVYNCAPYLKRGFKYLEKVYNLLSSDEFEIIYVNDGSTDNSKELLEEIATKKENIKVIHQENQGSSGARNTAIDIAKGEYLQFLDSDDYIDFEKVIPLLKHSLENNLDTLSYRLNYVNDKGDVIGERKKQLTPHNIIISGEQALIKGFNPSSICVFLFKRNFLNTHHLRITPKITHMDVEFTSRIMMKAERVLFKDIIAYHYLQREGSITKPTNIKKIKKLLCDEITVAYLVKQNINNKKNYSEKLQKAVEKNYNSIVWNLLWRFYKKKGEVSYDFKMKCLKKLENKNLYPIKGALKTPFQRVTRILLNRPFILKQLIKN